MEALIGAGVSPGVGFGPARRLLGSVPPPPPDARHDGDAVAARHVALAALEHVAADLAARGAIAGGEISAVLNAEALMARDPALADKVTDLIDEGLAPALAVHRAFGAYRDMLAAAGGYLGARVADLDDIRDRAVALLMGLPQPGVPLRAVEPYVLIARDLAPADTAVLTPDVVAAFVTEEGGPTSHTAILARALGVPAVVACLGATEVPDGTPLLVDGASGIVRLAPPADVVAEAGKRSLERAAALRRARGPGMTKDGHKVPLLANVGGPADLQAAMAYGAEGVGLLRTEFLFLDRRSAPSVDEQERAYREILGAFPGGQVVVRTLDAGADKPLAFLPHAEQPNPALGVRGLRVFHDAPEVLTDQLTALARARQGTEGRLKVMAPMIATGAEAAWFAGMCSAAGLPDAGAMIEIPAAALRAREIAAHAGFLSIGTNDLAQYLFAADRQVGALAGLLSPWQPALLDLVASAAGTGRPTGVCGEAAADPALACVLVGLGITSLSMTAPALPAVRAALAGHTVRQCRAAAAAARAATTPSEAQTAARRHLPDLADLGL
ncbi:phosphoenolpyruvate--protein phosphotransferase [Sinosporangium siamense]|uniref:Phosphoenolpyruvate-protein phosphotransferase n=1 Tax=Sinosporangium siamense TaxID=1367973 RepID=A0A919V3L2_9ACTN|nr:phosphoenolpyruvate--protein phosphotransferase [Sinosporangium siamense]GII91065.1 phosphoenolpyruvate-protein phosphotransferase [Sinosporangium siamense]